MYNMNKTKLQSQLQENTQINLSLSSDDRLDSLADIVIERILEEKSASIPQEIRQKGELMT